MRDLESKVAAAAIRNSGEKVKLTLGRMQPQPSERMESDRGLGLQVPPPTTDTGVGLTNKGLEFCNAS